MGSHHPCSIDTLKEIIVRDYISLVQCLGPEGPDGIQGGFFLSIYDVACGG